MMLGQQGIDDRTVQGFEGRQRTGLVHLHEMGVPDDVRRQDRRQTAALPMLSPWLSLLEEICCRLKPRPIFAKA